MGEEQSPWLGPEGPGDGYFLGHLPGMHLFDIRCGIAEAGWTGVACVRAYQIVLTRSGGYLRWINGEESYVDTTSALVLRSGDEIRVAHPLGCGDTYIALQYDEPPDLDLLPGSTSSATSSTCSIGPSCLPAGLVLMRSNWLRGSSSYSLLWPTQKVSVPREGCGPPREKLVVIKGMGPSIQGRNAEGGDAVRCFLLGRSIIAR